MPFVCTVIALVALEGSARAEHDHGAPHADHQAPSQTFVAGIGVIAATYEQMLFTGDYQGVTVSAGWSRGRVGIGAGASWYQLTRNGKDVRGAGDAMLHGRYTIIQAGTIALGGVLAVSMPTGDERASLGMGHWMVMPAAWASWSPRRFVASVSLGYGRALGDAGSHAEHGGGPIVDPMNLQEVTFGASAMLELAPALRAGVRVAGGVAIGDGTSRLASGIRIAWVARRIETLLDIEAGVVGDPYELRGVLGTALRFH